MVEHLSLKETKFKNEIPERTPDTVPKGYPNPYFVILGCCIGAFNILSAILALRGMWQTGYDGYIHASVSLIFIVSLFCLVFISKFIEAQDDV